MAKFDKMEKLEGQAYCRLQKLYEEAGHPDEPWETVHRHSFLVLIEDCFQEAYFDKYIDLLCEYWLDQYERGGFLQLWEISNGLIIRGDKDRFLKLWRAALRQRRDEKKDFLEFFRYYESALIKAGLIGEIFTARREYEQLLAPKTDHVLDSRVMSKSLFWDLIQKAKETSERYDDRAHELSNLLMAFSPSEIARFEKLFYKQMSASYSWDLWAAAYLAFGGCSDDGFEYFRAWLISEGRETFEAVLVDVNKIASLGLVPEQLEDLLSVATQCYKSKAGTKLVGTYDLPDKPSGKEWKEDDTALKKMYPCLWTYFNKRK